MRCAFFKFWAFNLGATASLLAIFMMSSAADAASEITVLGAVNKQQVVSVPTEKLNEPLAHLLSYLIAKSDGFTDFAKTDKLFVYFTRPQNLNDTKHNFHYNNECRFRFNTPKKQDDKDCLFAQEQPKLIYRVFVEGTKRKSRWSYLRDGASLVGNIAVPVILSTQNN